MGLIIHVGTAGRPQHCFELTYTCGIEFLSLKTRFKKVLAYPLHVFKMHFLV